MGLTVWIIWTVTDGKTSVMPGCISAEKCIFSCVVFVCFALLFWICTISPCVLEQHHNVSLWLYYSVEFFTNTVLPFGTIRSWSLMGSTLIVSKNMELKLRKSGFLSKCFQYYFCSLSCGPNAKLPKTCSDSAMSLSSRVTKHPSKNSRWFKRLMQLLKEFGKIWTPVR